MPSDSPTLQAFHRVLPWIGALLGTLIVALFIASFFLDDIVRARAQTSMNQKLTGYHVALEHAHLQLLGGILTLKRLTVIQQAHPQPPVADIAMLRFHIQVKELLSRRIVADVLLRRPRIHIDQTQFVAEKNSTVPLRQKGWQQALDAAYPFKINRITIDNGDVVYIQDAVDPPLHLAGLNFTADNIRNIHAPDNAYPSRFHATMVIFETGHATVDGHANFLEEPFPGARAHYVMTNVPLSAFDPEIRQVNITVHGGRLASDGLLEYSPKVTRVEVDNATIADVGIGYVHSPATQKQEAQRVKATGEQIEKQNNRPAVDIAVREFDIDHSNFSYTDQTGNPNYKLFINDTDLTLKNLSNHQQQGAADVSLHGKFMGSGNSTVSGTFLASGKGPAFDLKIAVVNTDLPSLNDLLRSFGRFDVAAGKLSVYSQLAVRDGNIDGYVKPMFADLEVYNYQKDKNTPILHQAKELVIGGVSHLLKSHRTNQVASDIDLKGKLNSPNVDTWQALGQVLRNAFIQAILPGFDRAVASQAGSDNTGQATVH
jgi:Domain of Unknown Function (DUF748)